MAEYILKNIGNFQALYGTETIDFSSNEVSTTIITGIEAVKSVDKEYWVNGPLTYTIQVFNTSGEALTNVTLTDMIDSSLATIDSDFGVKIDGNPVPYTFFSDVLSVTVPEIEAGEEVTMTFRVVQI